MTSPLLPKLERAAAGNSLVTVSNETVKRAVQELSSDATWARTVAAFVQIAGPDCVATADARSRRTAALCMGAASGIVATRGQWLEALVACRSWSAQSRRAGADQVLRALTASRRWEAALELARTVDDSLTSTAAWQLAHAVPRSSLPAATALLGPQDARVPSSESFATHAARRMRREDGRNDRGSDSRLAALP
jgi:hypothetical protein